MNQNERLLAEADAYIASMTQGGYLSDSGAVPVTSTPKPDPEPQGLIGDTIDTFERGVGLGVQGLGEAAHQFLPGIGSDIGAAVRDSAGDYADRQLEEMSPRMREAMGKQIFDEDADGNLMLGDGAYDGYTWLGNVSQAIGQYADVMVGGAGLAKAGLLTTAKIVGKSAAKKAAKSGATKEIAEEIGKKAAKAAVTGKGRTVAQLVGYGGVGSMMSGGMIGEQTREEILNLPDNILDQSEEYQKAYWQLADQSPESDIGTLRQQAKELIAEKAAAEVQRDPMLIASNAAMDAIGGKFLDDIFRGVGTGARTSNALKQMGIQGATESAQGGIEQYASNQAIIDNADPDRDPWERVKSNAATEGVMGGIIGGAGGFVSKGQAPASDGSTSTKGLPEYEGEQPAADPAAGARLGLTPPEPAQKTNEIEIPDMPMEPEAAVAENDLPTEPETPPAETAFNDPLERAGGQQAETQPDQKAPIAKGKRDKAFTPDNQAIDVSYSVIDLVDLKVSHDESGKANPDYPAEMQPRDRRNFASQLQIRKLAAGLQPERLAESANVGDGAPIIGPDGVVESGNGRAAAIRLAYRVNGSKAKSYKQFVQQRARELGVPADQLLKMKQPVLVRTRETEADRADFARRANKPQLSTMNDYEQALSDAQYIDQGMLSSWQPSDSDGALAASNRDFIRAFSKALGDNETAGLITNDGRATARFGQRMQAAIFAKAYDSPKLVEMLTDNTDGFRNIIGGLRDAAPDFAAAKTLDANAGAEMVRSISDSVELLDRSRQSGMTVKELLSQQDAFTADLPAETRGLAEFMSVNRLKPKTLSDTMRALGQMVRQEAENSTTANLFGDTEVTNRELIDESIRRTEAQADERAYQVPADEGVRASEQQSSSRGSDDTVPGGAETVAGVSGQNERGGEGNARVIDQEDLTADTFDLQAQTEQDLQQQADAAAKAEAEQAAAKKTEEARAQADEDVSSFNLTGSDSTVDQLESQGQSNLFDAPAEQNTGELTPDTSDLKANAGEQSSEQDSSASDKAGFEVKADKAEEPDALFRRSSTVNATGNPSGISVKAAESIAKAFMKAYNGNIDLDVNIGTQGELYGAESYKKNGRIKGAYHPARKAFTLAVDNLSSVRDAIETLRHEVLGHYGLNTFKPADKQRIIDQLIGARNTEGSLGEIWADIDKLYAKEPDSVRAEEVFARVVEKEPAKVGKVRAFTDRLLHNVNTALRRAGIIKKPLKLSDARRMARYIAEGIRDGRLQQQTFPKTDDAQFSKSTPEASDQQAFDNEYPDGMTAAQVQGIAARLGKVGDYVQVVQSAADLPMAIRVGNMLKGIPDWAQQGVYWQGKAYVIADNLFGSQQAQDVIVHEVVGHRGMRGLLGDELKPVMLQIFDSFKGSAAMGQVQERYTFYDPSNREHQQYLAEELLAHAAEYGEKPGLVKRAIAQIRRLLRKAFPGIAWTSNDIYALIDSARRFVERKNSELGGQDQDSENLSRLFGANPLRADEHFTDLDDNAKAALRKIAPETLKQKAGHWLKQTWDRAGLKLRQGIVDRYAALMDLDQKRFGEKAFEENITSSSFVLARMAANASGAVSALMQHGRIHWDSKEKVIDVQSGTEESGGLTQVLYKLGTSVEIERFMGWIAGNRAAKLAEEGRENLFTKEEIEALKSVNTGTTESGKDRAKLYDEVFSEFQQYRDDVLSIAEQAGIITSENRDMWKDEFYVPFYRVADEELKANGPVNSKGLTRQEAYKKLKGGKQNLNDLLENTLMNFHHLIDASLKNIAATQAVDSAVELDGAERTTEAARDKDNSTWIMRDGKKEWYNIADPLLYSSLVSLTAPAMQGPVMKLMRTAKRFFTQATTITPQFQVANLLRDSMQAIATSKMPYNAAINAAKGMAAYGVWNKAGVTRARMMATGGSMSFGHIYGADAEGVKLAVNSQLKSAKLLKLSNGHQILKGLWDKWMDVNDSFENANRAAIFEHNYKDGQKLKAAWEARDLIDFSAHGAWPTIRFLIDTVPFMNARIQGLDKLYRSGVKPSAKVIREAFGGPGASASDKAAAKRFNIVTGAIALATMSLYLANKDDEEYKKLEEWQKDTYWFIRMGDSAVFIPKPFEVGAIATFAERTLEQIVDDEATGELFAQRMGHMLSDTFSMNPTPQLFNPLLEVYSNHNSFTDRAIESQSQQRLSPEMRKNTNTSLAGEWGGAILSTITPWDVSPLQADHMIQGYFGQLGAWVAASSSVMRDVATGKSAPEKAWTEYQPIRRFYRDLSIPGYTKYQTLFYDRLNEVRTVYADIKKYRELGELEKAVAMANQHQSELAQRLTMERISRRLSKLNARARVIRASNMDGELKRRELDRIQTMKNRLTEITMKQIKDSA